MICDEDPLRRRPRESTARRKRQERCVWMARKMTEWPSKRGPITKIMPSDGCIGDTVPWRWESGTISTNLDGIWGMSGYTTPEFANDALLSNGEIPPIATACSTPGVFNPISVTFLSTASVRSRDAASGSCTATTTYP